MGAARSAHHPAVADRQSDDLSSQPEEAELFHIFYWVTRKSVTVGPPGTSHRRESTVNLPPDQGQDSEATHLSEWAAGLTMAALLKKNLVKASAVD
jgi:hypothetical protein